MEALKTEVLSLRRELQDKDDEIAELQREVAFLKSKLRLHTSAGSSEPSQFDPSSSGQFYVEHDGFVVPPLPSSPAPEPPNTRAVSTEDELVPPDSDDEAEDGPSGVPSSADSQAFRRRSRSLGQTSAASINSTPPKLPPPVLGGSSPTLGSSSSPKILKSAEKERDIKRKGTGSKSPPRPVNTITSAAQPLSSSSTSVTNSKTLNNSGAESPSKKKHRSRGSKSKAVGSLLKSPADVAKIRTLQAHIRGYLTRKAIQEKAVKTETMLKYTITEIWTTEQKFCESLLMLKKNFKGPMENSPDLIADKEVMAIFSSMDQIYTVNTTFLGYLDKIFQTGKNSFVVIAEQVGLCFLQLAPEWKAPYSVFCNGYNSANECLEKCKQRKAFSNWLKKAEAIPEMGKLGLADWLIKPVKRIPQYELLLRQVQKHLQNGSKAHQTVRMAKLIIRELATWINEKKKASETAAKINEVTTKMFGRLPALRKSGRNYLHETVVLEKSTEVTQKRLILFNDCLLVSHITGKFDRLIYLADLTLKDNAPEEELVFVVEDQSCRFMFSSATEKQLWKKEIQQNSALAQQSDAPIKEFTGVQNKRLSVIMNKIEKEGWLYKSSGGSWHRRWVTLEQGVIFFYKNKPRPEDTFSGCVDLNVYFLMEEPKYTSRRKFCLKLHNIKHKTWYLATETKEDRTAWFQVMKPYTLFGKKLSNKELVATGAAGPTGAKDLISFDDDLPSSGAASAANGWNPFSDGAKTMDLSVFTAERFDWAPDLQPDPRDSPNTAMRKAKNHQLRRSMSWDKSMFDKTM